MTNLMQTLFDYIIDHELDIYCLKTKRMNCQAHLNIASQQLQNQLTRDQWRLVEEYQECSDEIRQEELYAMFLAAFDLSASLLQRHTA